MSRLYNALEQSYNYKTILSTNVAASMVLRFIYKYMVVFHSGNSVYVIFTPRIFNKNIEDLSVCGGHTFSTILKLKLYSDLRCVILSTRHIHIHTWY